MDHRSPNTDPTRPITIPVAPRKSPPGLPELELASPWQRLLANIIDILFFVVVWIVAIYGLNSIDLGDGPEPNPESRLFGYTMFGSTVFVATLAAFVPLLSLPLLTTFALLAKRGQTVGKIIARIRIVRTDASDFDLGGAIVREIIAKAIPSAIPLVNFVWLLSMPRSSS